MMRSLQFKIFLWFCVVSIMVRALIVTSLAIQYRIAEPSWLIGALDTYAQQSLDAYRMNGSEGLSRYLDEIETTSHIRATLLNPESQALTDRGIPARAEDVLSEARSLHRSRFRIGSHWRGASVIATPTGEYIFVAVIVPPLGVALKTALIRWTALLAGGTLCLILARQITAPVRSLQHVASRIASGDLSVRASGTVAPRKDELADLAHDFDVMADRIQALLKKQQELLGDISHELRSPLARLGVSLELLRRGESDSVERMEGDLEDLNKLIERILTLTRLDAYGGRMCETTVNLRLIVECIAEDARFEGREQGKSVVVERNEDCWIRGDPALLRSCIENVVRNAVQHTSRETQVVIAMAVDSAEAPTSALVLVSDCGTGVPDDALTHLFEPFYRVFRSRDSMSAGGGLGLAIADRVVRLHGGTIKARNRIAGGLEVEIRLPVSASTL